MKLRTIAKLAVFVSIILFCIGVGFYSFAQLKMADKGKNVDLLSLVPENSIGLLETDNMEFLVNEFSQVAYAAQLDTTLRKSALFSVILNNLAPYVRDNVHGLSNRISRVMISFHAPVSADNVVVYFRAGKLEDKFIKSLVREPGTDFIPKKEMYRGKVVEIYPLSDGNFVSTYSGDGFMVASHQKRLIEEVIDAEKDDRSLEKDSVFRAGYHSKTANFITIYANTASIPLLADDEVHCWSEYDLNLNSQVFYLSGSMHEPDSCMRRAATRLAAAPEIFTDSVLVVSGEERVDSCITSVSAKPQHTLFDECVLNLSHDATFILVADLDKVADDSCEVSKYIPSFFNRHLSLFRHFILSVQIKKIEKRLSHIFILNYKE